MYYIYCITYINIIYICYIYMLYILYYIYNILCIIIYLYIYIYIYYNTHIYIYDIFEDIWIVEMAWNGQWSYGNWTERDRTNLHRFFSPIYKWATKFMAFSWVSFQGKFSSRAWVMRQSLCHKPSPSCWKWVVQTLHSLRLILGTWINIFTTDSNVPSPTRLSQRLFGLVKSRSKCTSWCHHPTGKYSHIYIITYV